MSQRLHHEVHPFVLVAEDSGHQICICGLWDTHHLHMGVSSAICTCMECWMVRDPGCATRPQKEAQDTP